MAIKEFRPTSPGRRSMSVVVRDDLTRDHPEKSLVVGRKRRAGRNHQGKLTVRHRGGGSKRKYRLVDFRRLRDGIPAKVAQIEYDPNRSAHIALLHYVDGYKSYIVAPAGLKVGAQVVSGPEAPVAPGNCLPLARLPLGTVVHNVEMTPGRGGQMARSAGSFAQLMNREGGFAYLRLPSGEQRMVPVACRATVGRVSNPDHSNQRIGKAGRVRWMGRRPQVRGLAMNPNDHPHGGGEGGSDIGLRSGPQTPWGKPALGRKTRRQRRPSDRLIVRRRKR
ncbi:MAG: 50S ribosomal protein L2 [Fimbriimonadaceae bacterium]|nr:50S ribosomal protein L2 [Fimbriimonadaceae bacterium]